MTRSLFSARFTSCLLLLLVFVVAGLAGIAHGQTPNLTFLNNYFVTGDHIVRDFKSSGSSTNGFINGTITIPAASSGDPEAIPDGADIVAAFLYWQTFETTSTPSGNGALFNGYSITGDEVGSDLPSACGTTSTVRSYRADVLPYLPVVNGISQAATTHNVGLPASLSGPAPGLPGASLVVVYRVLGPNYLKATVIYDGNSAMGYPAPASLSLPIRGFYDALGSDGTQIAMAKFTDVLGTVVTASASLLPLASYTWPNTLNGTFYPIDPISDDASQITSRTNRYGFSGPGQCYVWAAVVFTTRVHSADGDGLLDAWKKGPALPDSNAGKPGYYDVRPPYSWVDLAGAVLGFQNGSPGHPDIFIQYDWMEGTSPQTHTHRPPQAALDMVTQAFANHNVYLHFVPGNAITEDTCTADDTAQPPLLCMFPGEPGVVGWKLGLEAIKAWPANQTSCSSGGDCTPRFPPGLKDSYHYVFFGHSLALPTWSTLANTLVSIQVSGGNATVTTSASAPIQSCPPRVTIDGALATPNLNGVYFVTGCPSPTTFTISNVVNVADGKYPNTLPEPYLAVYLSQTDSVSGYSDVGGGDTAVTLGKWTWNGQAIWSGSGACQLPGEIPSPSCVNGHAGTLMHELGHTLALLHGGRDSSQPNCKPNYQSVMSYSFQVDLLQDAQANLFSEYSGQWLDPLDENNLSAGLTPAPTYPYTKWYSPYPLLSGSKPASSHCDGTPIGPNEQPMYAMAGPANPIAWSNGWDINFDGSHTVLQGYNDWMETDPRQIGASGNDYASGLIYSYTINNASESLFPIGNYYFSTGGGMRAGGGGGMRAGGGGGMRAGGGGGMRAGGGGGMRAGGGGGMRAGGGGGLGEANYNTIDSYPRPPRAVTASSGVVTWKPATFGNIQQYNIYRLNGSTSTLIACVVLVSTAPGCSNPVAGDPNATSYNYTDNSGIADATYLVTTVDLGPTGQRRESTPQGFGATLQAPLSVNVVTPLPYKSTETLSTSGGSTGGPVTYYVTGPCSLNGNQLTANSTTGSCFVTATMAGNSTYNSVTSAPATVTLQPWRATGFYPPVSMSTNGTTVWNAVKGGSTVPLKFNIYAGSVQQTSVGAVQGGTVYVWSVQCNNFDSVAYTTDYLQDTGATALRYDTTAGQFIQNWKTPKGAGVCYVAVMTAADNVTTLQAYFRTN